jgi:hypothetical protein
MISCLSAVWLFLQAGQFTAEYGWFMQDEEHAKYRTWVRQSNYVDFLLVSESAKLTPRVEFVLHERPTPCLEGGGILYVYKLRKYDR